MHLAQELLTNIQSSGGSRSFAKETRPLKMRNVVVAIWSWQWPTERITEADPLITRWEVAEELSVDHSTVIQHLKQIVNVKKLHKWVPHELTKNQGSHHFEVSPSLIPHSMANHFLIRLWHATKNGFYTTGDNQLSAWTEKKLQS